MRPHDTERYDTDLSRIARDYGGMVSALCRRMTRNAEEAEDAAQDVWVRVARGISSFRGEAKLSTWIYTIARNVLSRRAAKERVYSTRFLHDYFRGDSFPSPAAEEREKSAWVREMCDKCLTGILHCLDFETRLAYVMREIVGLSYDDLSLVIGRSPDATRQIVCRARRRLRRFLSDECGLYNPDAPCRCRMRAWVEEVDLPAEYEKLRTTARTVRFFKDTERVLPSRDFWKKIV
jgi:RNA polymerase sigma-70 factor, ECF subfamily